MNLSRALLVLAVAVSIPGLAASLAACSASRPAAPSPSPSPAAALPPVSPEIEAEYEAACAGVPADDRLSCPLIKWSRSVEDVDGGVVLHLGQYAPPPEQTAKRARCHRAWMARNNRSMRGPLSASGTITVAASTGSQGTDVIITGADPATVDDVRARSHGAFAIEHKN